MEKYRWLWAVTLLFYFSGCTVYVPAYLPGDLDHTQPPAVAPESIIVRTGLSLRLTMVTGETISGKVVDLNEEALAFGRPGNYGLEMEYYSYNEIEKIEVSQSTLLTKITTITALVITCLSLLVVIGLSQSFDSNN